MTMIVNTLGNVLPLEMDFVENSIVLSPFNEDVALPAAFDDNNIFVFESFSWMRSSFQHIQDCLTGKERRSRVLKFGDWGHYVDFGMLLRTGEIDGYRGCAVNPQMLVCPVVNEMNLDTLRRKNWLTSEECVKNNTSIISLWYSEQMEIGRDPLLSVVENERLAKYKRIWNAVKVDFANLCIPIVRKTPEEMNSLFLQIELKVPSILNSDEWKRSLIDESIKKYSVEGYELYRKVGS